MIKYYYYTYILYGYSLRINTTDYYFDTTDFLNKIITSQILLSDIKQQLYYVTVLVSNVFKILKFFLKVFSKKMYAFVFPYLFTRHITNTESAIKLHSWCSTCVIVYEPQHRSQQASNNKRCHGNAYDCTRLKANNAASSLCTHLWLHCA